MPVPLSEASDSGSGVGSASGAARSGDLGAGGGRLIADGGCVARNAFRVGLRQDTPLPVAASVSASFGVRAALEANGAKAPRSAGTTQELDPNDILEVQDMAAAIARAERMLASPTPARALRPDIFETLGRRRTDDTAGPATPAPAHAATSAYALTPTPAPPPLVTPRYVILPSLAAARDPHAPVASLASVAPALAGAEDDAFYHPVGRMRSLADVTLDGYRPEPTLLVRAASRRKRFSGIMVAGLLPLLVLAAIAGFASTEPAAPVASAPATRPRAPTAAAPSKTSLATSSAMTKASAGRMTAGTDRNAPPVFDVNSLPPARAR